ncbi:MAG: hypothetical protein Aureis2KO_08550 [Aureisphaera sp.]
MTKKRSNLIFYFGITLMALGAVGLTAAAFFAIIGLPVFVIGIILVLISKKPMKQKTVPIVLFIVGIVAFWPIWRKVNSIGPEVFLIPDDYRGKVNVIYKDGCGISLKKGKEGMVYEIPDDGLLLLNNKQKFGFLDQTFYLVDEKGYRTEIPKMNVRDFNEEWSVSKNPNEPPRDKLGVFHSGRTGGKGALIDAEGHETNTENKYTFQEFYVATYNDLSDRFNYKYQREFDSIREAKVKKCNQ